MKNLKIFSLALGIAPAFVSGCDFNYSCFLDRRLAHIEWKNIVPDGVSVEARPEGLTISKVEGRFALLAEIHIDSDYSAVASGAPRAEIELSKIFRFRQGSEYTVIWSTYMPEEVKLDNKKFVIFTQIHQGSPSGAPTLAITMLGNEYAISQRGGDDPSSVSAGKKFCCVKSDMNKWVNWRLEYIPQDSGQGALTRLWKNGVEAYSAIEKTNSYSGDNSAYLKFGLYKPHWREGEPDTQKMLMFFGPIDVFRTN